jgi:hypothetical protein
MPLSIIFSIVKTKGEKGTPVGYSVGGESFELVIRKQIVGT